MPLEYYPNACEIRASPAQAQTLMVTNFTSIPLLIAVDHYPFDTDEHGKHKKTTFAPLQATPDNPQLNEFILCNLNYALLNNTRQLFLMNNRAGIFTNYPITAHRYTAGGTRQGWTILPGNLLVTWGITGAAPVQANSFANIPANLPKAYPDAVSYIAIASALQSGQGTQASRLTLKWDAFNSTNQIARFVVSSSITGSVRVSYITIGRL